MSKRANILHSTGFPGRTLIWLMVVSIMFVATSELLADWCGGDCEDHCEEPCHGCGDCILCLPSIHMIAWDGLDLGRDDSSPGWAVFSPMAQPVRHPAADIDHPPQNLL